MCCYVLPILMQRCFYSFLWTYKMLKKQLIYNICSLLHVTYYLINMFTPYLWIMIRTVVLALSLLNQRAIHKLCLFVPVITKYKIAALLLLFREGLKGILKSAKTQPILIKWILHHRKKCIGNACNMTKYKNWFLSAVKANGKWTEQNYYLKCMITYQLQPSRL